MIFPGFKYIPDIAGTIVRKARLKKGFELVETVDVAQTKPEVMAKFDDIVF